jgi:hypothetical protein
MWLLARLDISWTSMEEAAEALMRGELHAAIEHGELDDAELRRRVIGMRKMSTGILQDVKPILKTRR